jgi:hypothetical protein
MRDTGTVLNSCLGIAPASCDCTRVSYSTDYEPKKKPPSILYSHAYSHKIPRTPAITSFNSHNSNPPSLTPNHSPPPKSLIPVPTSVTSPQTTRPVIPRKTPPHPPAQYNPPFPLRPGTSCLWRRSIRPLLIFRRALVTFSLRFWGVPS